MTRSRTLVGLVGLALVGACTVIEQPGPAPVGQPDAAPVPEVPDAAPEVDLADAGLPCEGGDRRLIRGDRCYVLHTAPASWPDAEAACVLAGGHLLALADAAESSALSSLIGTETVWLGLTDAASEGSFVWSSGDGLTYTGWAADQPDNGDGGEHCAEIRGSEALAWNDKECDTLHAWICEY